MTAGTRVRQSLGQVNYRRSELQQPFLKIVLAFLRVALAQYPRNPGIAVVCPAVIVVRWMLDVGCWMFGLFHTLIPFPPANAASASAARPDDRAPWPPPCPPLVRSLSAGCKSMGWPAESWRRLAAAVQGFLRAAG